jgi:uncharacterized protein (TIGR02453 family)
MITKEYFKFFVELEDNNNKEWFDANRKRYEKDVKAPFSKLVEKIISEIAFVDESISSLEVKDAIFRINRDIRFSNDKTPYKTRMSAIISPSGKKDKSFAGIYFEIDKSSVNIYGGVYMPDKDQLLSIRNKIAEDMDGFHSAIANKEFVAHYGGFSEAEQNKRLPKELMAAAEEEPLIYNKAFFYHSHETIKDKNNPKIVDIIMIKYLAAKPVADWLQAALTISNT